MVTNRMNRMENIWAGVHAGPFYVCTFPKSGRLCVKKLSDHFQLIR
jgi:hypothetical protein